MLLPYMREYDLVYRLRGDTELAIKRVDELMQYGRGAIRPCIHVYKLLALIEWPERNDINVGRLTKVEITLPGVVKSPLRAMLLLSVVYR